jgi:hypothetical protein
VAWVCSPADHGAQPIEGSQPSLTENMKIRLKPSAKFGSVIPTTASAVATGRTKRRPVVMLLTTTAVRVASAIASTPSSSVTGRRGRMASATV